HVCEVRYVKITSNHYCDFRVSFQFHVICFVASQEEDTTTTMTRLVLVSTLLIAGLASLTATNVNAQGAPLPSPPGAPLPAPAQIAPSYAPEELDRIVSPIALYPDPLLGQILTAATFSPEIPDAARWSDQHHYVPAAELPAAIAADRLPWQPGVQALLPFPQVLDMMASSMPWTEELGGAFL